MRSRLHAAVAWELGQAALASGDQALALAWLRQAAGCEGRLRGLYERPHGTYVRVGWRCVACGWVAFDETMQATGLDLGDERS